ncbi:MAG: tRNA dihydrouridine synthase DusB [Clostridiales bacterium]|jgi:nifR3 family TIM-barrel protein|nr:tRNA dihydrouridine synthase DusB [Clostridiales bacterium]
MKIGNIELKNNLMLAPLAGYTDVGFRSIALKHGAALTCSEMVSAKGLLYDNENTKLLLLTSERENPSAVQLFGREPDVFFRAAKNPALKKFDIIDVNMGCPVQKIVKNGEGSALLKDKGRVKEIIAAVRDGAPKKAVTAKIRAGFDGVNAPEIALAIEEAGGDAVAVHARLREQYYHGKADWEIIREVKSAVKIPVIGNGDVASARDYADIMEISGCDFVMIGRGAIGNPYIFGEILGNAAVKCQRADITEHIDILLKYYAPRYVTNNMKKHILAYCKGKKNAKLIKERVTLADSAERLKEIAEEFFAF